MSQNRNSAWKRDVTTVIIPATLLVLILCGFSLASGCSRENAFKVNGEGIPSKQFEAEVDRRLSVIEKRNPEELEGEKGEMLRVETRRQVATEMIKDALMRQQAEDLGAAISAEVVGRRLEEERLASGLDEFQKNLDQQGLTEEEYKKTIERQVLVEELGKKVCEQVSSSDEELETYYLTHKDMFTRAAMVHAAHILLDTENEAKAALSQLDAGRTFASVARAVSKDSATRSNGGDLGWMEQGTMDPAFEQAAFSLDVGGVSGVVKASKGFHVITVLDKRDAYALPFEEVRTEVKKAYLAENKESVFSDWLKTVYGNADVEIPGELGEWDPVLGIV
ncbi:MAG: peptidylprolyl isomerase, partial [Actinobacteria bacterium]|nr:peptidylprolyl isomerase [Actinomycetota bacterium]